MSTPIDIRPVERSDLNWVAKFLDDHWGSTKIVTRGKAYYAHELPGFLAIMDGQIVGLVTCRVAGEECEIMTLDSLREGEGVGSALLDTVQEFAMAHGCHRIWLITVNDNLKALRFYMKRGYRLVAVHRNALEQARRMKPEIPLIGKDGIPLYDEIELELVLT